MPSPPAGRGIDRQQRAGVEVISGADVAVPVGSRVADAPVQEVQSRVIGAGQPGRAAARLPALLAPGLVPRLAGSGDRVGPPEPIARPGVVRIEEALDPGFAAADADDDLAVDGQGAEVIA